MDPFNLVILAGGEKGPLYNAYGCSIKAMLPIHGKPMLDWVVEAFSKSQYIDSIVVVGPEELENLQSMQYVRKRIFEGVHVVQNMAHAVTYIKA